MQEQVEQTKTEANEDGSKAWKTNGHYLQEIWTIENEDFVKRLARNFKSADEEKKELTKKKEFRKKGKKMKDSHFFFILKAKLGYSQL